VQASRNLVTAIIATTLSLGFLSPVAEAQSSPDVHPWLDSTFIVNLGGFYPRKEFTISVDGESSNNEIDFDRDAGVVDSEATGTMNFHWRFGEKWSMAGQYYATRDSGQAVLDHDIEIRDSVIRAGSNIGAGAELDLFRVFFGREFFTDEPYHEFGIGAGVHWLQIGAFVEGEIFVNDISQGFKRETAKADLPLPNVGTWYWRSLSPHWLFTARLDWFSASIDEYSGDLWNAGVGIQYQPWENLGFGLSYQYFKIDVDLEKNNWNGSVALEQDGPALSVSFNW
jgi:hypothetical protein